MPEADETLTPNPDHFRVRVYGNSRETAYLELPDHPHKLVSGITAKTVALHQLLGDDYNGPALNLDFDQNGRPIGIEILYPMSDDD
jgi:hypothetical protein